MKKVYLEPLVEATEILVTTTLCQSNKGEQPTDDGGSAAPRRAL